MTVYFRSKTEHRCCINHVGHLEIQFDRHLSLYRACHIYIYGFRAPENVMLDPIIMFLCCLFAEIQWTPYCYGSHFEIIRIYYCKVTRMCFSKCCTICFLIHLYYKVNISIEATATMNSVCICIKLTGSLVFPIYSTIHSSWVEPVQSGGKELKLGPVSIIQTARTDKVTRQESSDALWVNDTVVWTISIELQTTSQEKIVIIISIMSSYLSHSVSIFSVRFGYYTHAEVVHTDQFVFAHICRVSGVYRLWQCLVCENGRNLYVVNSSNNTIIGSVVNTLSCETMYRSFDPPSDHNNS